MKFCDPPISRFDQIRTMTQKPTFIVIDLAVFESFGFELLHVNLKVSVELIGEISSKWRSREKKIELMSPNVNF